MLSYFIEEMEEYYFLVRVVRRIKGFETMQEAEKWIEEHKEVIEGGNINDLWLL